jgi:hypothetical protein
LAAGVILAAVVAARAETWNLELKRLEPQNDAGIPGIVVPRTAPNYLYRITNPQQCMSQIGGDGNNRIRFSGGEEQAAAFKRIVKTEPKYECDYPFRGVFKLGSQEYAFALDMVGAKPKQTEAETKTAQAPPKSDSLIGQLAEQLSQALNPRSPPSTSSRKVLEYNRLYFDANHNGDLTDDKVMESKSWQGGRFQFPRLDLTIEDGAAKIDCSFFISGQIGYLGNSGLSSDIAYASVALNAAAYREGDITLEGKKHHVVLLDFNSNGRFGDETTISTEMRGAGGQLYPNPGDVLLVDPDSNAPVVRSPYDLASDSNRILVSKLVSIDDRLYDMKLSPAGDQLTLTPSSVLWGSVTNPNNGFRAMVYSDRAFLNISGEKDTPIPLPEGQWKVLNYTIEQTWVQKPSPPAEKKEAPKKGGSALQALTDKLEATLELAGDSSIRPGPHHATVTAYATADYKPVTVRSGETVVLPFGPPYSPTVKAANFGNRTQLSLELSLLGSAGEVVTNLAVDNARPPKPDFTITDNTDKVVQSGNFEYG